MVSVISKELDIFNAKQFKESVSEPNASNVYITFGKTLSWSNDTSPPQANTNTQTFYEAWRNMIGGKRLTGNDIRHVIPRFNWTANTVYYAYDDRTDSKTLKNGVNQFYVITDAYNVYKCLANNYGANSTVMPTQIITSTHFQTEDGYLWKYMYTLDAAELYRFTTNEYIPVRTVEFDDNSTQYQVQDQATTGAIHNILITNTGSDYTSNNISITVTGDGIDCNAYAIRNVTTNLISSIIIDNKGYGYTYANVTITAANGSGSTARAVISPPGGHGSDALTELGGSYLILNPKIVNSEDGLLSVQNDYRQIAIIEDPLVYGTSNVCSNTVVNQLTKITLTGVSAEYLENETVYQGSTVETASFKGTVFEWDSTNNMIHLSNVEGVPDNSLLQGESSTGARFLSSVTNPDLTPFSGKLLYIDNIQPIERAEDQTESFQIILKF